MPLARAESFLGEPVSTTFVLLAALVFWVGPGSSAQLPPLSGQEWE